MRRKVFLFLFLTLTLVYRPATSAAVDDNRRGRVVSPSPQVQWDAIILKILETFNAALHLMEEKGEAAILADLVGIVNDGGTTSVDLGEALRRHDASGDEIEIIEERRLGFAPKLGRDGVITIDLTLERDGGRVVTTRVRVCDGEPFVIGHLLASQGEGESTDPRPRRSILILNSGPLLEEISAHRTEGGKNRFVIIVMPHIREAQG
ncbi:MAG: hypothetical protein LBT15_06540, partial [Synergistaceae bacterium]|nr:hypothetical protein [Synergistaceae bacterium]